MIRRIEGPEATELFMLAEPRDMAGQDAAAQTKAVYTGLLRALQEEGATVSSVSCETLFLRDIPTDLLAIRRARALVLEEGSGSSVAPPTNEIEQPPLHEAQALVVTFQAIVPTTAPSGGDFLIERVSARADCPCSECAEVSGLRVRVGREQRFHAGGVCGRRDGEGAGAFEETLAMFGAAEDLLREAGMDFHDVVRTWIHLGEMERDYAELNRGRRVFFADRGIEPVPASTGIGGRPVSRAHDLCLGLYAIKAEDGPPGSRTVMSSPTLNEAGSYGADFVRGMKVSDGNKIALHVSGTASIDEAGQTAHVGDFDAQVDRMLLNVAALLEEQGASMADIVSATTYVKHPRDAERLREKFRAASFDGFPNALVHAEVCRPELLVETEVLAVRRAD